MTENNKLYNMTQSINPNSDILIPVSPCYEPEHGIIIISIQEHGVQWNVLNNQMNMSNI